ncbi:MAG TPA: hypothetical protein VNO55_04615 [Polyangia bacterium]|nr:hypothetical protein [Polyangia bacterium]
MAWTAPPTYTTGQLITAALANQQWRDNLNLLATSIETSTGRISGEIKNFSEEVTAVSFSATPTFDLSLSNNFKMSLTGNVTAITISNWVASKAKPVVIKLTQDATGGRTVTFPAGWKWASATVPVMTAAANKADILVLWSDDGGTTIYASMFGQNF